MKIDARRISRAISLLERLKDGTPNADELEFTGRIGERIEDIADEFLTAVTAVVGATMDMLDDVPEEEAPIAFRNRLETLFRRMMTVELTTLQ